MSDDPESKRIENAELQGDKKQKQKGFLSKFLHGKLWLSQKVTEEDILTMIDEGEETGSIEQGTKSMIENIFDFHDTEVTEIMTHRTDIYAASDDMPLNDVVELAISSGHSRIPVFHGDIDNIAGVLYVKDLLKYVCSEVPEEFKITDITRSVLYVPKTKMSDELFSEMTASKIQLAIVVDEYGGTEGLITMEDLIESIVGSIQDEYDDEDDGINKIAENTFSADGATKLCDIAELLDVTLPSEDYETIAGLILEKLGRIPEPHERPTVTVSGVDFTAELIEDRRIAKVLIEKNT